MHTDVNNKKAVIGVASAELQAAVKQCSKKGRAQGLISGQ